MCREKKHWHPDFINYMKQIIAHPHYNGLPVTIRDDGSCNWIAPAKSEMGEARKQWAINKGHELGIDMTYGSYADVMLYIHPFKEKPCQICGTKMSLYYYYPNSLFLNNLNKKFDTNYSTCDHIFNIWDNLIMLGFRHEEVADFFITAGELNLTISSSKEEILNALEYLCRVNGKKMLGPGAMSNFPDRFDGFHSYNRCCRSSEDKGRSKENLQSYAKDRRAYEYWSDGNIHAANQFMASSYFDGISADHIGPISLGFIHDSHFIQPMTQSDNSSKRDRLLLEDIEKLIQREKETGICAASWYCRNIWFFIKECYEKQIENIEVFSREILKQNMSDFMYVLWCVLMNCSDNGKSFLISRFLSKQEDYFEYDYAFTENGNIISKTPRHTSARRSGEIDRYYRIALQSVFDYNDKSNRNVQPDLTDLEQELLGKVCQAINRNYWSHSTRNLFLKLCFMIQNRLIYQLEQFLVTSRIK